MYRIQIQHDCVITNNRLLFFSFCVIPFRRIGMLCHNRITMLLNNNYRVAIVLEPKPLPPFSLANPKQPKP